VKILAIRLARLGDVILSLPALGSLKGAFPKARLTFLTGHRCAPIAELCPHIDEVIAINRVAMREGPVVKATVEMVKLVRDIRGRGFDLVVDFHSFRETNLLTWLSGAPVRGGLKRFKEPYLGFCFNQPPVLEDKSLHVAEMFRKVAEGFSSIPSSGVHPPFLGGRDLLIPNALRAWAAEVPPKGPKLALYVDAPVPERVWPPERFAEVADFAIEKLGAEVLVLSGKQGTGLAGRLQEVSRNRARLSLFTDLTVSQLAALIGSARVLVSNDTGPMHIGPAVGVRTLGLFSVGYPEHFRPIGPADRFLRANPIEKIEVLDVIAAVDEMWPIADPDPRR
jgi:ADP-heptose:LPS heptosyltransferase